MSLVDYPRSGLANSSEFTSSGIPYVKSGNAPVSEPEQINFQFVTKAITVKNNASSGSDIAFGFTRNGVKNGPERFILKPGESVSIDVKVKEVFIMTSTGAAAPFSFHASLTMIPERFMTILTGSAPVFWDGVG